MTEHLIAAAAIIGALAAVGALLVTIIRSRKSLSEFFGEEDQPMPRGFRWFTRGALIFFGMFYGMLLCERCLAGEESIARTEIVDPRY